MVSTGFGAVQMPGTPCWQRGPVRLAALLPLLSLADAGAALARPRTGVADLQTPVLVRLRLVLALALWLGLDGAGEPRRSQSKTGPHQTAHDVAAGRDAGQGPRQRRQSLFSHEPPLSLPDRHEGRAIPAASQVIIPAAADAGILKTV
jgi:hypothetical protein